MVAVGLRLNQAQGLFFDRQKVQRAVGRAERKVLSKFGAFVRQDARSRIRRRKRPSRPGESPTNQTGRLKRTIFFVYDEARRSVVIGPIGLGGGTEAPATLEHGGLVGVPERTGRARGRRPKRTTQRVVYAPRPYMGPAFEHEQPKLPDLWRNSVR